MEGLPERRWHPFPEAENAAVLDNETWRVTASPARHSKPTAGFRIEHRPTGRIVAYSADTGPAPEIARLAADADVLVHEATGTFESHSTAVQAAEIAALAGVSRLLLVHLPPHLAADDLAAARRTFPATEWGEELGRYEL